MRVDLLRTKLFPPRRRSGLVQRERLLATLRAGFADARLILIDAPPGWGKTTVLVDWLAASGAPLHGWVSLDADDNDPIRFWTYCVAALQDTSPGLGEAALEQLRIHGIDPERDVLPDFVNELTELEDDLVLVLDDYQVIRNAVVHESLASFLELAPPQVHVALVTRADPPLPLARMRARGQLLELRAAQLRFTSAESSSLLNDVLSLSLSDADVDRLVSRTEGWVAGLQLAGLTLRDRDDASAFIAEFAGEDRHIVDYLGAEVLDGQPADVRDFLLKTSVLARLSAPLCAAVTGVADAAAILAAIDQENLFVVALDNSREWFRYHHLFGELLRHELQRQLPDVVPDLHRRAAEWLSEDPNEAVAHAAAADDATLLVSLVDRHWRATFNLGQLATVDRWLDLVPHDAVAEDEELSLARVWVALDQARLAEAAAGLADAARAGVDAEQQTLLRALLAFKEGDVGSATESVAKVPDLDDPFWAAVSGCLRGLLHYWSGEPAEALPALERATQLAMRDNNALAAVYSLGYRALTVVDEDPAAARRLLDEARPLIDEEAVGGHFVTFAAALAGHHLARVAGQHDAADLAAARAVELSRRGAGRIELAAALAAAGAAAEARGVLDRCRDPGIVIRRLADRTQPIRRAPERRSAAPLLVEHLTEREQMILRLLTGTGTNREIAAALFVSPNTLKTHLRAIYRKLDVADREDAVARGRALGLL